MKAIFDIFARLPDGGPIWIECVEGVNEAKRRVSELSLIAPREYFIYSETSGAIQPANGSHQKMRGN
jgi:hypothetical protein